MKSQGHGSFSSPRVYSLASAAYLQAASFPLPFCSASSQHCKGACVLIPKTEKRETTDTCVLPPGSGGGGRSGRRAGGLTSVPTLRLWREERAKGSLLRPRESRAKGQGFQVGLPSSTFTEVRGAVAPQSTSYTAQCSSNNQTGAEKVSSD